MGWVQWRSILWEEISKRARKCNYKHQNSLKNGNRSLRPALARTQSLGSGAPHHAAAKVARSNSKLTVFPPTPWQIAHPSQLLELYSCLHTA